MDFDSNLLTCRTSCSNRSESKEPHRQGKLELRKMTQEDDAVTMNRAFYVERTLSFFHEEQSRPKTGRCPAAPKTIHLALSSSVIIKVTTSRLGVSHRRRRFWMH